MMSTLFTMLMTKIVAVALTGMAAVNAVPVMTTMTATTYPAQGNGLEVKVPLASMPGAESIQYPSSADLPEMVFADEICQTEDGGLFIVGSTDYTAEEGSLTVLMRLSETGGLMWAQSLEQQGVLSYVHNVFPLEGDRFVMLRAEYDDEDNEHNELLIIGDGEQDVIPLESPDGVYVMYTVYGMGDGFYLHERIYAQDYSYAQPDSLTRYDAKGKEVHTVEVDPNEIDTRGIVGVEDGALLFGSTNDASAGLDYAAQRGACMRLDADGETVWTAMSEPGEINASFEAAVELDDGGFLLVGEGSAYNDEKMVFDQSPTFAVRLDADGAQRAENVFQPTGEDFEGFYMMEGWLRTSDGMAVMETLISGDGGSRVSRIDEEGALVGEAMLPTDVYFPKLMLRDDTVYVIDGWYFASGMPLVTFPLELE